MNDLWFGFVLICNIGINCDWNNSSDAISTIRSFPSEVNCLDTVEMALDLSKDKIPPGEHGVVVCHNMRK